LTPVVAHLALTLGALAVEAVFGYPEALFRRIGHPVTWLGALISRLDAGLNRPNWPAPARRAAGALGLAILVATAGGAGILIERALLTSPLGLGPLAVLASSLLAQRSLHAHVAAVASGLETSPDEGRRSVAMIVGRDVSTLDAAGVSRAAIESLAENFSDGVVAPALWMALAGLPGALIYKAVNTADSMIGHRSARHEAFGWAAARLDDLLNLPASRLSAALIAAAAAVSQGASCARAANSALRDARRHLSPNAGWPEAAMAGALGLSLGGPRSYGGAEVEGAYLGRGRRDAMASDIWRALAIFRRASAALWLLIGAALSAAT
jgi:adenosylcobinamide-phosphate synthase